MTLIEDARRLAETDPTNDDFSSRPGRCRYCDGETVGGLYTMRVEHAPDCPWLSMTRIVAALEAAERVVEMRFAAWCAHADVITDLAAALHDEVTA